MELTAKQKRCLSKMERFRARPKRVWFAILLSCGAAVIYYWSAAANLIGARQTIKELAFGSQVDWQGLARLNLAGTQLVAGLFFTAMAKWGRQYKLHADIVAQLLKELGQTSAQ